MPYVKSASALARPGVGFNVRRLGLILSNRRFMVASSQTDQDNVNTKEDTGRQVSSRQRSSNQISVDFEQTQQAYKSKDSLELLRSLVVFKLCSYDLLVDKNTELMDLSKKLLGQKAFEQLMKLTFYGQFVAGEDHQAIRPLLQRNQAFGVGTILDYSAEEDVRQDEVENKEIDSHGSVAEMTGAHTYCYSDEAKCDEHMENFLKCIRASGGSSMDSFTAIKMTALGRPHLLLQFSEVLVKWRCFFNFLAMQQGKDGLEPLEQRLDLGRLQDCLTRLSARGDFHGWFTRGKQTSSSGTIDLLDWNSLIDDRTQVPELLVIPNMEKRRLEPLLRKFTEEEEEQMKRMLQRTEILAKHAQQHGVRLMVDAEQTYLQPAINRTSLEMQQRFNREKPLVFNTYQCYLTEAYNNVSMDVELSRREGWLFGAKLVRGAYMYQERARALELGYDDPINPDYESTNTMYHRCLDYVLDEIGLNRNASVMVASHNEGTVEHTLRRMNELGLTPTDNKVYFGQLLGMCDQISFPLAHAGFPVYKYVPYGLVSDVIPYLSRRAQENRGFMKGSQRERELLWTELTRRLTSGEIFYRPVI